MNGKEITIGVLGLTHLGCVLSASWSKLGFCTVAVDLDEKVVVDLKNNIAPIFEPGLEEEMKRSMEAGLLSFSQDTASLAAADFIFLGFDTEVDEKDAPDTSFLESRMHQIGPLLKPQAIVIVSSQVPAGGCRMFRSVLKSYQPGIELAYSPENLQLGQAIQCYLNPERIILGAQDSAAQERCLALFRLITQNIITMSLESAELVKHGINAFLATSIVFANQLADCCEKYPEANMADVIRGIKSDVRIGPKAYLSPGIGFSGGTLGRDVAVLGQILDIDDEHNLFRVIHAKNAARKKSIIQKVKASLTSLSGKTIGVLGITYKPGTSTLRRSLPLEIIQSLLTEGAKVQVFDPKADYASLKTPILFEKASSIEAVARGADLLLLLTEWQEFKQFDWARIRQSMRQPRIFDAKNALDRNKVIQAGLMYQGIGGISSP